MFETVALFSIFAAFSLLEWSLFSLIVIWLVFATGSDRNYENQYGKWLGLAVLLIAGGLYSWKSDFQWVEIKTFSFWKPVIVYLLLGLVYSVLEFLLEVYRSKNHYTKMWKNCSRPISLSDFCNRYSRIWSPIQINYNYGDTTPYPKINKSILAQCISAWIIFWPFYAISLILFDVMEHVWDWIAELFVSISSRFVKAVFKDVFKPL